LNLRVQELFISAAPLRPSRVEKPMKIASWNVNSLTVRLPHLLDWLAEAAPDVLALQEIKLEDGKFPHGPLRALGYHAVCAGQKTYNGVAILSRKPATDVHIGIAAFADEQRRVIAATVDGVRVINVYVVNGQAVDSEKFAYKMRWLEALRGWLADELSTFPRMVVLGDFNIAPDDRDVHDPAAWKERILCSTPERDALRGLLDLGLHDAFRLHSEDAGQFSWWDYRAAAFRRNMGLRIDLVLVSEALRDECVESGIDPSPRGRERPSDHAPVWVTLRQMAPSEPSGN
jgi:exodeoxyribonuclease III